MFVMHGDTFILENGHRLLFNRVQNLGPVFLYIIMIITINLGVQAAGRSLVADSN